MMEEMFRWLFIGFIAGLWLSLGECESGRNSNMRLPNIRLFCCKTHFAKACCMQCLFNKSRPVHVTSEKSCEVHGWTCVDSEDAEHSLSCCADIIDSAKLPDSNISESKEEQESGDVEEQMGTPINHTNSGDKQCVCISPHCKKANIGGSAECDDECLKWNCNHNCCIVCHKEQKITHAVTPGISSPSQEKMSSDVKHSPATNRPAAATTITPSKTTTTTTTPGTTPRMTTTTNAKPTAAKPGISSHATNQPRIAEENNSSDTTTILLVLLLFVAIIIIIAAVVLFMRKRKFDKRNELSPTTYASQGETVSNVYAGVFPDNGPSGGTVPAGNHIYDELDMLTEDPTPSNVYDNAQPTSVAVDMGRSVDYVDIDLPMKDRQKPMNSSNAPLSLSPVYSQPFESPTSAINTEYAEPFKPDNESTAAAPVLNHSSAAGDQQNDVYSLAKAIPLSDSNVIYSQPNKPAKSTGPTDESGGSTDPIHSEATGVEPGAESRGSATQDPNAVYAEPMKLKKSS